MRILIVSPYFWPEAFRINDLASGLRDRGHVVEVLTGIPNYPSGRYFDGYGLRGPWRETFGGIVTHRVPMWPRGNGSALRLALNYVSYALFASAWAATRRTKYDAIIVFQVSPVTAIVPALFARRAGVPVIAWVLDLWPETLASTGMLRSKFALRATGALSRWLYRQCDVVLGQSAAYREPFEQMGVPPDRIVYFPSWAEEVYDERPKRLDEGFAWEAGFTVMFAGNLGRVQALDTVLDAAAEVRRIRERDCQWIFVGDGSARAWLESEVRSRGLEDIVHLVGRRPLAEMPSWYDRASAMLVSLKQDPVLAMTVPGKVQSYMAAGVPILASIDGEGARVVVEAGAGLASSAGDSAALAQRVLEMMALPEDERRQLGARGRAYYRDHFSRDAAMARLDRVLERFCRSYAKTEAHARSS